MLEEKLVDLQIQISALTIAIEKLTLAVTPRAEPQSKIQPDTISVPEPKPEPKPTPTPLAKSAKNISIEIADDKVDVVSIDVLRDKCMQIVRADPSCKPDVMALIATFGGAEKVQDVPVENRLELLKALEQL
jgi:hypothetical protein